MSCIKMDIRPLLEFLKTAKNTDTENALDGLITAFTDPVNGTITDEMAPELIDNGLLDILMNIAQDEKLVTKTAQLLAEIAKTESAREPCVKNGFVPILLNVLDTSDDLDAITQACRALGNMCFENDLGRGIIEDNNGIPILLKLLRSLILNTAKVSDNLRLIACGFLLNLTNSNEILQQKALDGGALDIVENFLKQYQQEKGLCNMVLLTIASLTDTEICKEMLLSSNLCTTLVEFLGTSDGDEQCESVLHILTALAEWDEVKDALAQTGLCKLLIKVSKTKSEDYRHCEDDDEPNRAKLATDLLILLLTGEKSMEILFENGKGEILQESLKWLHSDQEHLQHSGALAVGNFARSDEHCRLLIEQGVIQSLLALLKPVYGETNCTLEHAILSALRNLAIPASNKATLIREGVIDAVLVLVDSELLAVIFKMLGVLRMLVDGQEDAANRLGQDREFIIRLVEWSSCDEHPGVKGEATRLMAWLIKNSCSEEVIRNIIRADGIPHLVSMATSEHVVMQNESLVALILTATKVLADAALPLKEAKVTDTIQTLLKNKNTLPEILCNSLTLTKTILTAVSSQPNTSLPLRLLACTGLLPYLGKSGLQNFHMHCQFCVLLIKCLNNLREDLLNSGILDTVKQLTNHKDEKVKDAAVLLLSQTEDQMSVDR